MTYRKITYIFLAVISVFTLVGITWLGIDDVAGFGFLSAIVVGYFVEKKWQKKKDGVK